MGAALLLAAALLAACGTSGNAASGAGASADGSSAPVPALPTIPDQEGANSFDPVAPGSGKGLKLGYISLSEAVPFVHIVSESIRESAERAGAEIAFCDSRNDAATALDCAKTMATQNVDGLLNYQADAASSPEICAAGPEAPVLGLFIQQLPCQKSLVGVDNEFAGEIAGMAVGNYFKERFDCEYDAYISLQGYENGEINAQRMAGYDKGFSSFCGEIHDRQDVQGSRIDQAQAAFANVLSGLPNEKRIIVVGFTDDAILGALAAARTQGREGDLYVAGQGADPSAWCQIKSNPQWIADTAYFPEKIGPGAVSNLIAAINGESISESLNVPVSLVNGGNIEQYYEPSDC